MVKIPRLKLGKSRPEVMIGLVAGIISLLACIAIILAAQQPDPPGRTVCIGSGCPSEYVPAP